LRTVNQHDLRIDGLTRNAELARAKFMQYSQTLEEARIDRELQIEGVSNISVVQPATLAEKPVFPSRSLTVAGTFVLAMFGTLGLVLISDRDNAAAPQVSRPRVAERRIHRRRARRELTSKANGHAEPEEVPN
jgi:uncharacterized protein involved in exopolysaccharide biosynthesis